MNDYYPDDPAAALATFPASAHLVMINLLQFREQARYPGSIVFQPCTGRAAYFDSYMSAFAKTVKPYSATDLLFAGHVVALATST